MTRSDEGEERGDEGSDAIVAGDDAVGVKQEDQ